MKWTGILFMCCAVLCGTSTVPNNFTRNVVCYYSGNYGMKVAPPESLNSSLCTHLNYAFVKLDENGILSPNNKHIDIENDMYKRILSLKKSNSKLKVLISIGDTTADVFSKVAADPGKRKNLVNSTINYLKLYGFDGVDVDWERPYAKDESNFIALLRELKEALTPRHYMLSIAVYPYPYAGYNVPEITKNVNMINLMCYNFYGHTGAYTGHNAALFASPAESVYEKNHLNTAMCLENWLKAGASREKVIVGIPFYGRTFTLVHPDDHHFHSPISGSGKPPTATFPQTCTNFKNYTAVWDHNQKVYYKYYKDQWLTYDDERSVKEKAKYIRLQNVAGAMIWQIGQDDINGDCGPKQGLLQVVNQHLNEDII